MAKRHCAAITRKGTRCKAHPLKGSDKCLSHADAKAREAVGFVARNGKAGRKPRPKPDELVRQRLAAAIDYVLAPHFQALGIVGWNEDGTPIVDMSQAAMEVGRSNSGKVTLTEIADLAGRIAAAEKLIDRGFGKATQVSRDETVDVDAEIARLLKEMDRREKAGAHANGNGRPSD